MTDPSETGRLLALVRLGNEKARNGKHRAGREQQAPALHIGAEQELEGNDESA